MLRRLITAAYSQNLECCFLIISRMNNTANNGCLQCVFTDKTASQHGPVIIDGSLGRLNIAGCVAALTGQTGSTGCGAKFSKYQQCRDASCSSCADPSSSQQAYDDYQQCTVDSESSYCSTYTNDAACIDSLIAPGGTAEQCAAGSTFLDNARTLAKLFCVP